jgi:NAD(P)-dependent dehydrogenase (short-subunit alcohol dehydrogenase family)
VTGGNKGIGKEIVRQLSAQGLTAVLTSRDARLGAEAAKELSADVGRAVPFHQARPAAAPRRARVSRALRSWT